jgi:uncharacterized protein YjdB
MNAVSVLYAGHVQDIGDMPIVKDGQLCGTEGISKRLESVRIFLETAAKLGIEYETHVQNEGWGQTKRDGEESGTKGKGERIEAIRIRLTGEDSGLYDVFYGTHVQNIGNMQFAKNGESTGTEGLGLRMEGLRVIVIEKGMELKIDTLDKFIKYVKPAELDPVPAPEAHPKKSGHGYIAVGHGISSDGGWDSGCVDGPYTEAGLMLPIVKVAVAYLRQWGVTITTDADDNNNKNMLATVAEANAVGADFYVSVHCDYNAAPSGTYPIIYPGSADGECLAHAINGSIMLRMGMGTRGILQRDDYEVSGTDMKACIFETGSIRNDLDKLLDAEKYGFALAQGIYEGI